MMELRDFLSLFAEALLIIALPIIIAAAIQHLRLTTQRLRAGMSEENQQAIEQAVRIAVRAAEQLGLLDQLAGPEKRKRAIEIAQAFLQERGIRLDLDKIASLIEAEVLSQFNNPDTLADTAQARQALIDKAVEAAVLAAEQSGMSGLIRNIGIEKKAYALQMATQYLRQHGITVDTGLLGGLIEAQLLRLMLAARGELPDMASTGATDEPAEYA
jgi:hypothetical protein